MASVVSGIEFVLGSIPNGAGTMVLRCFLFSASAAGFNLTLNLDWSIR